MGITDLCQTEEGSDCVGEIKLILKQKTMTIKGSKEELKIKADTLYVFLKALEIFTSKHSLSVYDMLGHILGAWETKMNKECYLLPTWW